MRGIVFAVLIVVGLVAAMIIGLTGDAPGLLFAGFCLLQFALIGLGWSLGRSRLRIITESDLDDAPVAPPTAYQSPLSGRG